METVVNLLHGINGIFGLVGLVCFVLVVVKMFQNSQVGLGIASIVLLPCCLIGYFIAFVMGWIKSGEWNIRTVMLIWTVILLVEIVVGAIAGVLGGFGTHSSMTFQTVGGSIDIRP